ncbi:MAG: thymidine phosphorylase [Bacteroidota bacterium]
MNPVELIRKKRSGDSLTEEEFRFLISRYVDGKLPDYQMSAFLMACYFRGMSEAETLAFTSLMLHSGEVVDLSDIPGVKVDKHSTGGVGDKVSLILAPIVAACGVPVPMISGRGLGHTGGTLDKLESIPGFRTDLTIPEYKKVIREIGIVMIGQTKEIAPADKKMYALRDVTATVECIPLIAGSIMSKKLAEGIDALVLDIKTGRGAFMQTYERSLELAKTLVAIGNHFGTETIGFITDMNQPLGTAIGNWLEVVESVGCLRGSLGNNDASSDLMEVTLVLSGAMLFHGKKAGSIHDGVERARAAVKDGTAYRKFLELVEAQGGKTSAVENLEAYPVSRHTLDVKSSERGYVTEIDSLEFGLTSITLGAGRQTLDDPIDPKAGIILKKKVGDAVEPGVTLATIHTDKEVALEEARVRIAKAFTISNTAPKPRPLILSLVDKTSVRPWKNA